MGCITNILTGFILFGIACVFLAPILAILCIVMYIGGCTLYGIGSALQSYGEKKSVERETPVKADNLIGDIENYLKYDKNNQYL